MKTHTERKAEAADAREQITAAYGVAQDEARRIIQAAASARDADTADLEARIARESDEAVAHVLAAGDARLFPIVRALHDEPTNKGIVALIEAIEALDRLALSATGEVFPLMRVALLLAEVHRQDRPAILEHLSGARAWHSASGGGLGGVELATELRKAVERHDVAGVRAAFEKLDGRFWSLTQKPVDAAALVAWQARLQPDPRVLREHQAASAAAEREAQAAVAAEACAAAVRAGAKLGFPEMTGVTYQ